MRHVADFHAATAKLHQKNGGINLLFMGPRSMVVVSDPDAMKQVHTHTCGTALHWYAHAASRACTGRCVCTQVLGDTVNFPKVPPRDVLTSKQLAKFFGVNFLGQNGSDWFRAKANFAEVCVCVSRVGVR